jgi:hypothetical protein
LSTALTIACGSDRRSGGTSESCTAGEWKFCNGPNGCVGRKDCLPDGSGYGECDCDFQGPGGPVGDDDAGADDAGEDDGGGLIDPNWQNADAIEGTWNWQEAKDYCDSLEHGDQADWRLPTIDELRDMIDGCPETDTGGECRLTGECLDDFDCNVFCEGCDERRGPGDDGCYWNLVDASSDACGAYWSASPLPDSESHAWAIDFRRASPRRVEVETPLQVRCRR